MNFQKNHDFPKNFKNSIKKCEKNEKNIFFFPRPSGSLAALAGRTVADPTTPRRFDHFSRTGRGIALMFDVFERSDESM